MAKPVATRTSYKTSSGTLAAVGMREDLSDVIYRISPTK